jgi:SAM-dependent methyltransferase
MNSLLQNLYETHHKTGGRLRQSLLESFRGGLFRKWIGSGKKVVDLGCRDGTLTRHFLEGNAVVGCDIDAEALRHVRDTLGIATHQVDLNSTLPFKDKEFDVAVLGEVLEHLPYWSITLAEVKRILRGDGMMVGTMPLAYHLKDRWNVLRGKKLLAAGDRSHVQLLSYDDFIGRITNYFDVAEIVVVQGGRGWRARYPRLFARNVAFRCVQKAAVK